MPLTLEGKYLVLFVGEAVSNQKDLIDYEDYSRERTQRPSPVREQEARGYTQKCLSGGSDAEVLLFDWLLLFK